MLSKIFREIAMTDKVYCLCHARVFSSPQQNNYNKVCHTPSIRQVNQITGCGLVSRQCAAVAYDHALVFYLVFKECICQKDESVDRSTREAVFFDLTLRGNFQLMSVFVWKRRVQVWENLSKNNKKKRYYALFRGNFSIVNFWEHFDTFICISDWHISHSE